MKILCCGCSFTKVSGSKVKVSYCDFLIPDTSNLINIGQGGIGISLLNVLEFLESSSENISHFIFQVPSPARQPVKINHIVSEKYLRRFRCFVKGIPHDENFKDDIGIWNTLLNNNDLNSIESIFLNKDSYYDVSIKLIDKVIDSVLTKYPDSKIILFRYEKTNCPLINEFSKNFYKKRLKTFSQKKKIQYVYNKSFTTEWFRKKGYTCDETHPNETGAKLIADKLKEFL